MKKILKNHRYFKAFALLSSLALVSCGALDNSNMGGQQQESTQQSNSNTEESSDKLVTISNGDLRALVNLPTQDEQKALDAFANSKGLIQTFNLQNKVVAPEVPAKKITFSEGIMTSKPALVCYYDSLEPTTNTHKLYWAWAVNTAQAWSWPAYSYYTTNASYFYLDSDELRTPSLAMTTNYKDQELIDVCNKSKAYWSQSSYFWNYSDLIYKAVPSNAQFAYYTEAKSSFGYSRHLFAKDRMPKTIFNSIVAFGDSLSDTGNLYRRTDQLVPREDYYYRGRFTNGFNWLDSVQQTLNLPVYNSAYASAETRNTVNLGLPLSVIEAIQKYHEEKGVWSSKLVSNYYFGGYIGTANYNGTMVTGEPARALFSVYAGGNNYLDFVKPTPPSTTILFNNPLLAGAFMNAEAYTTQTINDLENAINSLINLGGKYFIVPNLPDLGSVPQGVSSGYSAQLNAAAALHNTKLLAKVKSLATKNPTVVFIHVDVNAMLAEILANQTTYHFSDSTNPCYSGKYWAIGTPTPTVCPDVEKHLFWDTVHPTKRAHGFIAYLLNNYLLANFAR